MSLCCSVLRPICFLGLVFLCSEAALAQSYPMKRLQARANRSSAELFLKTFPYGDYLKVVEFTDFDTLQQDRYYVWTQYGEGDAFLYHLGQHFIDHYPVGGDIRQLNAKAAIGLVWLKAWGRGIHARNIEPYHIVGYYLLGQVSSRMSERIAAGKLNPDDPETAALINTLSQNKVHVAFERSFISKLVQNAKGGKWDYIADRVTNKVRAVAQIPEGYLKKFPKGKEAGKFSGPPPIELAAFRSFHRLNGGEVKMNAFTATDRKTGEALGHVVFLHRPSARAGYAATGVQQRLSQTRNALVAMTGGFTNNYRKPEGLTIDRGRVVNAVLMHDRDALVLVEKTGGIRVINLDRDSILLPGKGAITNPRKDLVAFSQLLKWCRATGATTFQTQLLAFGHELLIDPGKASSSLAERRLLALTTHRQSGEVRHVIFNIRKPHSLAGLSEKAFHVLEARDLKVDALLNLDTGGQDVMQVYDERRRVVPEICGRLGTGQTTNLLIYSH